MQDSLILLEAVNNFYSQSFNQLVAITVAVLAFAGVIMPILISLYQKRLFKLEHEEIKRILKIELNNELKIAIEELRKEHEEREKKYISIINELDQKLDKEISGVIGANLHVQGNINLKDKNYISAFVSLTKASRYHLKAGKEDNLRRTLRLVIEKCLPMLTKDQFEKDETIMEPYEDLVARLSENNENGRYMDDLRLLRIGLKQAMSREPL